MMDEDAIKAELARQIVEGDKFQVALAREKIDVLDDANLVDFRRKPGIVELRVIDN